MRARRPHTRLFGHSLCLHVRQWPSCFDFQKQSFCPHMGRSLALRCKPSSLVCCTFIAVIQCTHIGPDPLALALPAACLTQPLCTHAKPSHFVVSSSHFACMQGNCPHALIFKAVILPAHMDRNPALTCKSLGSSLANPFPFGLQLWIKQHQQCIDLEEFRGQLQMSGILMLLKGYEQGF